ncbi:MAG: ABC transporter ATP-binding protein [Fusobacteriaceae bacterium]
MTPILQLKKVFKNYESSENITEALKNINLDFYPGEFTAIIGSSGSGKTTLLNLMGALDNPTSGNIFYQNKDISSLSLKELADFRNSSLGFVFQFHHLLPELTLKENILIPSWILENHIENKEKEKEVLEILKIMNLQEKSNENITKLSGGQQQRAAIARALINKPGIILADEPTGNLDNETTNQIYTLLREINKKFKTTFIIVTHDLNIANRCDRIIRISDGEIIEDFKTNN